jgi:phage FluMu protein Com
MNFKQVASYDNYVLANMTLGLLQENEINCHLKDEYIVTIDPLLNPAVGGIKLMVAEQDEANAIALIQDAENQYLKDIECPICHTNNLQVEEKKDEPTTLWGILKNKILYGQTNLYTKNYRCQNCKSLLTELPTKND